VSGDRSRLGRGHLVRGHPPGEQTNRLNVRRLVTIVFLTVVMIVLLGLGILFLTGADSLQNPSDEKAARVGGVILTVFAVLMMPGLYAFLRIGRPRQASHLSLEVEPVDVCRGGQVKAMAAVKNRRKLGDKLELALVCTEFFDAEAARTGAYGYGTVRVTRTTPVLQEAHELDLDQDQKTLTLTIPAAGLCSYEGGAVSWAWTVELRDHHGDRSGGRNVPIWVSP
jgi:hypothetical protein